MSATRDKTQKITFVYSNLYALYRKGVDRAREGATQDSSAQSPSLAAEALTELATNQAPSVLSASVASNALSASRPHVPQMFESGVVLKAKDMKAASSGPSIQEVAKAPAPRVTSYSPAELLGKRIARPLNLTKPMGASGAPAPQAVPPAQSAPSPVESLKQNLQSLNDLQARLRFMLKELEDLIKE